MRKKIIIVINYFIPYLILSHSLKCTKMSLRLEIPRNEQDIITLLSFHNFYLILFFNEQIFLTTKSHNYFIPF